MKIYFGCTLAAFAFLSVGAQSIQSRSLALGDPVKVEVWTTPQNDWDELTGEEGPNVALFATLKEIVLGFGAAVDFEPNYYINDGDAVCSVDRHGNPLTPSAKIDVCNANCANNHRYCVAPPTDPKHSTVLGLQLLAESLRRQCIWKNYGENFEGDWVEESTFFDYLQSFLDLGCDNFDKVCIGQAIDTLHLNGGKIQKCFVDSGGVSANGPNTVFESLIIKQGQQKINRLQSLPALFINGQLQTDLSTDVLFTKICELAPKDKLDAGLCDGNVEETLGEDEEYTAEEEEAKEELEEEIAEDLAGAITSGQSTEKETSALDEEVEEEEEKEEEEKEDGLTVNKAPTAKEASKAFAEDNDDNAPLTEEIVEQEEEKLENLEAVDSGLNPVTVNHHDEDAVIIEVWTTPDMDWNTTGKGDGPNIALFDHLKEVVLGFDDKITFRPQMYISSLDEVCGTEATLEAKADCGDMNCVNGHKYCAVAPDDWKLNGELLVKESLRRLCIWEAYGRNEDGKDDVLYFDYIAKFHEKQCDNVNYKESCIVEVLEETKIDATRLNVCMQDSGGFGDRSNNEILQMVTHFQKKTFALHKLSVYQFPIVLINGRVFEGAAEKTLEELFGRICLEFAAGEKPDVCLDDIEENLGEDEDKAEENDAKEELEKEIAEDLGEKEWDIPVVKETLSPLVETESPTDAPTGIPSDIPTDHPTDLPTDLPTVAPVAQTTVPTEASIVTQSPILPVDLNAEIATKGTEDTTEKSAENPPEEEFATESSAPNSLDATSKPTLAEHTTDDGSLYSLDLKLVDAAIDHLAVLQQCDVDTASLVAHLMALADTDISNLKDTVDTIEKDMPLLMAQECPHDAGVEILSRMEEFHKCALFNLQDLIETFPSTATGVFMRCADAYSSITKVEEEQGYIPEQCIRTLEADSTLGRGLFGLYLYPDRACPCFEHLGDGIPECTADVWPIPINGALVKVQSCLVGQYCQKIDGLCEDNLRQLDQCLPPKGTLPRDMVCEDIFDKCSGIYSNVPPMLTAAPLPDACVRVAEGSKFFASHIVERYDYFRHKCGKNIELWEGHTPVAEFKAFIQQGAMGIDYRSLPFVGGALGGFFAGIIFCIVVVLVRKFCLCVQSCISSCCACCCGRKNKLQRPKSKEYRNVTTDVDDTDVESEYHD